MRHDLLQAGIALFNDGRFFECHEVLEEDWTVERGPSRLFLQSLIHVAVGFYHHGRDNPVGAGSQLRKALRKMAPYLPAYEGVDTARLESGVAAALARIEAGDRKIAYPRIHPVDT